MTPEDFALEVGRAGGSRAGKRAGQIAGRMDRRARDGRLFGGSINGHRLSRSRVAVRLLLFGAACWTDKSGTGGRACWGGGRGGGEERDLEVAEICAAVLDPRWRRNTKVRASGRHPILTTRHFCFDSAPSLRTTEDNDGHAENTQGFSG